MDDNQKIIIQARRGGQQNKKQEVEALERSGMSLFSE
jgi:hypothetical protein